MPLLPATPCLNLHYMSTKDPASLAASFLLLLQLLKWGCVSLLAVWASVAVQSDALAAMKVAQQGTTPTRQQELQWHCGRTSSWWAGTSGFRSKNLEGVLLQIAVTLGIWWRTLGIVGNARMDLKLGRRGSLPVLRTCRWSQPHQFVYMQQGSLADAPPPFCFYHLFLPCGAFTINNLSSGTLTAPLRSVDLLLKFCGRGKCSSCMPPDSDLLSIITSSCCKLKRPFTAWWVRAHQDNTINFHCLLLVWILMLTSWLQDKDNTDNFAQLNILTIEPTNKSPFTSTVVLLQANTMPVVYASMSTDITIANTFNTVSVGTRGPGILSTFTPSESTTHVLDHSIECSILSLPTINSRLENVGTERLL